MPRPQRVTTFAVITFVLCLGCFPAWGQNDVLTQHNDNTRSGLNANETLLTPASVNVNSFGQLFAHNVDGQIAGQPLIASQVLMNDGLVHDVVYVATQNNTVYAFDADNAQGNNASPLWSVNLDDGGTPDPISDYGCTGTHYSEIGIMGTPVIDPGKTTLYVVAKTVIGTGSNAVRNFSLHALDITTGNEFLGGPMIITGTAPSQNGSGTFNPVLQMQRPALLLENGVLYISFGGNGCDEYAYNGWLFAYNAQTLQQESAFLVTPDGTRASLWQGGSGPAADENGYVYVATANGTYDGPPPAGNNDFGDSVLKMGWSGNALSVLDFFTPYNQSTLAKNDLDLGSSGPLILPDQPGLYQHELVVGGKQGTLYLVNRDNLGQYNPDTDNVIQEIPQAVASELMGVATYWNGSVYVAGEGDHIKQFPLVDGQLTEQPVSETAVAFTGFGPASTSISANGNTNGILWAIRHTSPALFAFDPTNLANEFWNSTQAAKFRDKMIPVMRFATPTISNGRVYVGGSAALEVYGLLPSLSIVTGNNQAGMEKAVLPIPLTLLASDGYASAPQAGVVVTCRVEPGGGKLLPSTMQTTNSSGMATFSYTLPSKVEAVTITCSSPGYVSAVFDETCASGPPKSMSISSGNNQTVPPSAPLPAPLVVEVVDANGLGVPGATVNFTDNGAGGTFASTSIVTGSNGTAAAQYTMGPNAGNVTITASSSKLTNLNFTETASVPANITVTGGSNQSGSAGTKLPQALTVLVTDAHNNPISGVNVTFSDGGAGGSFSNSNPVVTGSNGTATQFYTLPTAAGTVTITATAAGVTNPASFIESSLPGPPAIVAIISGNNQSSTAGTQLPQALTVAVTDQFGNSVPNVSVTFSDGGAGGTFYNPNPGVTGASGLVSQTYLLPTTAATITITATANGVTNPAVFTETAVAGNAVNIAITGGNNQTAPNGTQLPLPLTVLVTDQYNNPVAGVSVTFSDGGVGGTFSNPNPGPTGANGTASQLYTLPALPNETITITATAAGIANPAVFTEYGQ